MVGMYSLSSKKKTAGASSTTVAGVIGGRLGSSKVASNAVRYTNGLKVLPGWRRACMTRLYWLRPYERPPTSATSRPLAGSIAIMLPCTVAVKFAP